MRFLDSQASRKRFQMYRPAPTQLDVRTVGPRDAGELHARGGSARLGPVLRAEKQRQQFGGLHLLNLNTGKR